MEVGETAGDERRKGGGKEGKVLREEEILEEI